MPEWRQRVQEMRLVKPGDLADHPYQHRLHRPEQRAHLVGILDEIGIAGALLAWHSERNHGALTAIDGHLRKSLDAEVPWPTLITDLNDQEADILLMAYDWIGAQAQSGKEELDRLLHQVQPQSTAVLALQAQIAEQAGLPWGPAAAPEEAPELQIDRAAELQEQWGTCVGQLWVLGRHRLLCGDSTDKAVVERVLQGEHLDVLLTDPPYSSGGQFRSDRTQHTATKYVQTDSEETYRINFSGDNRDQRAFLTWASLWLSEAFGRSREGSVCLIFTDWRQLPTMSDALQCGGWVWRNLVTWWKPGCRMQRGRFSLSAEYLLYGSNAVPCEGESSPQNVLQHAPVGGADKEHIAEKPVELLRELLSVTIPQAIVYDPFLGSGTTLLACEQLGRRCFGIEIDPGYVAVCLQRMQDLTGLTPRLVEATVHA